MTWIFALGSMMGWSSWSSEAGSTRSTASSLEMSPSATMSTAILTAAWAVRLPVRVWSMIERAFLHRELEILHVAVVLLELVRDLAELVVHLRHFLCKVGDRMRRADAGHHVLALGVRQILAVELLGAGRRIAGEAHARCRSVAHVAEDHGLDVHGGAEVAGDVVQPAVGDGAGVVPGAEDGVARHDELLPGVLRETRAS